MSENCYIYIDEGIIYIQCVECYKKNKRGSFWPASNGYGAGIKCKCGKVIHENPEKRQAPTPVQDPRG